MLLNHLRCHNNSSKTLWLLRFKTEYLWEGHPHKKRNTPCQWPKILPSQFSFSELQQVIVPHFGLLNYLSVGRSLNRGCTTPTQHLPPCQAAGTMGGGTYSIPLSNISGTHCAATNVQVGVGGVGGVELNYLLRCAQCPVCTVSSVYCLSHTICANVHTHWQVLWYRMLFSQCNLVQSSLQGRVVDWWLAMSVSSSTL